MWQTWGAAAWPGRDPQPVEARRSAARKAVAHLPPHWQSRLSALTVAFQPIVNAHTGAALGFECLVRGWERSGWDSIQQLFDEAHRDGLLSQVSTVLRHRAVEVFASLPMARRTRLFLNVDNREIESWPDLTVGIGEVLAAYDVPAESICLEVSEKHPTSAFDSPLHALAGSGVRHFKVAIDDFGTGFSGLKLLYLVEPDFIKIDRFFIAELGRDARKRIFVSSIVSIAHGLGVTVIAEGVETLAEFRECRAVGCDLMQGFFIQPPTCEVGALRDEYPAVVEANRSQRRRLDKDEQLVAGRIEAIPAISVDTEMSEVLHFFRQQRSLTFVPVVNQHHEPVGIVRESDLREYAYSSYGKDLLRNPSLRATLPQFVVRAPVADIHLRAERILEIFSHSGGNEGILVVDNASYVGFLSAQSLLQILNEKNLALARDQNPLTRLPGNTLIYEVLSQALQSGDYDNTIGYFDFDHFKPFNDCYGFRAGDRAILLFAELFQKLMLREGTFLGHIGGDDFFALVKQTPLVQLVPLVSELVSRFASDVSSLYTEVDRQRGFIEANDRLGRTRRFPLLTVSAALLYIPAGPPRGPLDTIVSAVAAMKRTAKTAPGRLCIGVLDASSRVTVEVP